MTPDELPPGGARTGPDAGDVYVPDGGQAAKSPDGAERLLGGGERSRELCRRDYRDTELEVNLRGPDVTADSYYERVQVTKIGREDNGRHGWTMLSLPADQGAIDQFITALVYASNRLAELEADA